MKILLAKVLEELRGIRDSLDILTVLAALQVERESRTLTSENQPDRALASRMLNAARAVLRELEQEFMKP